MFIPQQQLSIDKAMISFKGRLSFFSIYQKVGDKGLGTCWFKNGVRLELEVVHWQRRWSRKWATWRASCDWITDWPWTQRVSRVFDNYYTSPRLCKHLHTTGFGCCGIVRLDRRNIPEAFRSATRKKGEIATYHDDELFGLKWKDKRVTSMLSIIHDDTMISKERHSRQAPGGVETIQKPLIIEDYNQYMGGVDKNDQLVVLGGVQRNGGSERSSISWNWPW